MTRLMPRCSPSRPWCSPCWIRCARAIAGLRADRLGRTGGRRLIFERPDRDDVVALDALRAAHRRRQLLAGVRVQARLVVEQVDVRHALALEQHEHAARARREVRTGWRGGGG